MLRKEHNQLLQYKYLTNKLQYFVFTRQLYSYKKYYTSRDGNKYSYCTSTVLEVQILAQTKIVHNSSYKYTKKFEIIRIDNL